MELPEWKLYSLEMDSGGREAGEFFQNKGYDVTRVDPGADIRIAECTYNEALLFNKEEVAKGVKEKITTDKRVLALYGHGGFHFFTYGLVMLANRFSDDFGYIHIDHHADSWMGSPQLISCAGFVAHIQNDSNVNGNPDNMLFLGNEGHIYSRALTEQGISKQQSKLEELLEVMPDDVYVTMDLDVMHRNEVRTAFFRGKFRLDEMAGIIRRIKRKKRIISADILGFTECMLPRTDYHVTPPPAFEQSMRTYEELAKCIMEAE